VGAGCDGEIRGGRFAADIGNAAGLDGNREPLLVLLAAEVGRVDQPAAAGNRRSSFVTNASANPPPSTRWRAPGWWGNWSTAPPGEVDVTVAIDRDRVGGIAIVAARKVE